MPLDPWHSVPSVLGNYNLVRRRRLFLQKVWFGGGHAEVNCTAAPFMARFTRYGTRIRARETHLVSQKGFGAGKPVFSTRVMPRPLTVDPQTGFVPLGGLPHCVDGITQYRSYGATH